MLHYCTHCQAHREGWWVEWLDLYQCNVCGEWLDEDRRPWVNPCSGLHPQCEGSGQQETAGAREDAIIQGR